MSSGADADTMFEDIGHSKDARTKMAEFFIGNLKVILSSLIHIILTYITFQTDGSAKPAAKSAPASKGKQELESKGGLSPVAIIVFIIAILLGVYFSQQK